MKTYGTRKVGTRIKSNMKANGNIRANCAVIVNNDRTEQDDVSVIENNDTNQVDAHSNDKCNVSKQHKGQQSIRVSQDPLLTAQTLQQAIIWADILDKPVSKRRRGGSVWRLK